MIASTYAVSTPVDEVIDRAGLRALADRRVSKCSGGEQQRLRFALALLPDPRLLVLDEPTAGMDVTARRDFWDTMHADASAGRTVVFATHYLEEADAFADRIVLIAGGRIVADGTTAEIRSRASGRTVSATLPPRTRSPRPSRGCAPSTASATSRSAAPGSSSRPPTPTRWRGCSCSTSTAPTSRSSPPASSRPS